jgi:CRP-like cAMP-binding protein
MMGAHRVQPKGYAQRAALVGLMASQTPLIMTPPPRMTRQEVGDYLGLTIKTVSRAFRAAPAGIVAIGKHEEVRVNDICHIGKLTGVQ